MGLPKELEDIYKRGKPAIFVHQSVVLAESADSLGEFLERVTGRREPSFLLSPVPPLSEWLALYTSHRRVLDSVGTLQMGDGAGSMMLLRDKLKAATKDGLFQDFKAVADSISPNLLRTLIACAQPVPFPPEVSILRTARERICTDMKSPSLRQRFQSFCASPEGQFFIRIWFPCWALYQTYPPLLMRRARRGCTESLDRLLRLDKSAAFDPEVAIQIHRRLHGDDLELRQRMERALSGFPSERLDSKRMKYMIGGLISQLAELFHCRVTSGEIETLFNRLARARGPIASEEEHLQDNEISGGEAFAKAIQRNRKWPAIEMP